MNATTTSRIGPMLDIPFAVICVSLLSIINYDNKRSQNENCVCE